MELLIVSFLAGILTILAPCVVSVIPILLARAGTAERSRSPLLVIVGLSVSIIIFTVLLKASTVLIGIPTEVWKTISGGIVLIFGIVTLLPGIWEWLVLESRFVFKAQEGLGKAQKYKGPWGDLLLGASLGPVFSACSPTYALIVAAILPVSPLIGLGYLVVFVLGLALMLALIAIFGQKLIKKLGWGINPKGLFHKILGLILVTVGIMIITGFDKTLLGWLVQGGFYDFQIILESQLMN